MRAPPSEFTREKLFVIEKNAQHCAATANDTIIMQKETHLCKKRKEEFL